jgi:hypothetical protein
MAIFTMITLDDRIKPVFSVEFEANASKDKETKIAAGQTTRFWLARLQ